MYINTQEGYQLFLSLAQSNFFVDKSLILTEISNRIDRDGRYLCVTRPRRFGKSHIAYLIESYFSNEVDTKLIFDKLKISKTSHYTSFLNNYNVMRLDFSHFNREINSYEDYISYIDSYLKNYLIAIFPNKDFSKYESLIDMLYLSEEKFIFIFDEWEYLFNQNLFPENHNAFLEFLRNLLKGRAYVALCYMTGILPIKKYSNTSALNMFEEFTFLNDTIFSEYFGFTEEEVKSLCVKQSTLSYNEVASWYNGYSTKRGKKIFNPRSVKLALTNSDLQSYWTNTGSMIEIGKMLKFNTLEVRDDIIKMLNGEEIRILIMDDFRGGTKTLTSKKEIYSAMITLGFLSYSNCAVRIPNRELMMEFEKLIIDESFGELAQIIKNSQDMLDATLAQDCDRVASILHDIHNLEIPILTYNNENSLSCVLTLAYLSARDYYRIEREEKNGKGYVDFIFYPRFDNFVPIIIELKKDASPDIALGQIVEKEYAKKLVKEFKSEILIVGINYTSGTKEHTCKMEMITI